MKLTANVFSSSSYSSFWVCERDGVARGSHRRDVWPVGGHRAKSQWDRGAHALVLCKGCVLRTLARTHTHSHARTHTHALTRTRTRTRTRTHKQSYVQTLMIGWLVCWHRSISTRLRGSRTRSVQRITYTHARTNTHTHTHTYLTIDLIEADLFV